MKNLKLLLLFLPAVVLTSCGNDDYSEAYVDTEAKVNLVATLEAGRTMAVAGTYIDYTVTMPQSFAVEATVTVRATSVDGSTYTLSKVVVPAGSTTVSGRVKMPAFNGNPGRYEGTSNAATMEVDGVALAEGNDPFTLTSNAISLTLIDPTGWDGNADQVLKVALDWSGPYGYNINNNLNLWIYDADLAYWFEVSTSTSRFEGDWFNNPANENHPDGDYQIYIRIWDAAGVVDYNLQLTHPSGTVDFYEGDLVAEDIYIIPVGFTKTTVDGVSSYVTYAF